MSNAYDLTPAAVGEILGVHWTTVNRWADAGLIPCQRTPGGWRRFKQTDVDTFLASLAPEAS